MNADWITQLAPARAPPPPAWWPPAIGWWVVAGLILVLLGAGFAAWKSSAAERWRRVRRAALAELERIRSLDEAHQPRAIQHLMRRHAVSVYGAGAVAPLHGEAWLDFIRAHGGGAFAGRSGQDFLAAAYGKGGAAAPEWLAAAEAFIRCRPPRGEAA